MDKGLAFVAGHFSAGRGSTGQVTWPTNPAFTLVAPQVLVHDASIFSLPRCSRWPLCLALTNPGSGCCPPQPSRPHTAPPPTEMLVSFSWDLLTTGGHISCQTTLVTYFPSHTPLPLLQTPLGRGKQCPFLFDLETCANLRGQNSLPMAMVLFLFLSLNRFYF